MSYAGSENLSRSTIFKVLMYFITCVAFIFILFINQVVVSSETFYHQQLKRDLVNEANLFSMIVNKGDSAELYRTIAQRKQSNTTFSYIVQPGKRINKELLLYPTASLMFGPSKTAQLSQVVTLPLGMELVIKINPQFMQSYRETVIPMLLSGIAIPVIIMLAGASLFAVVILKKLARVNQGMNRVILGEKGVKLPVSTNDDEFDVLAMHLNFLIEQVEKKETSLKALSVGMAHDLRTPIARMKLRLERLLTQNTAPYTKELEACHDDLEVLLSMFNGMLEIANLNSGKQHIDKEWVDLSQVCRDVVEFLLPISDEKQQQLSFREDQPYRLQGEPSLLFRAVYNLVENSIKYTPEQGVIDVIVDHFGVVVIDNGMGVSNEDKKRIREPMFRADRSRTHQGFGLGLSLVEAVVIRHNGELVFSDNHPGLRSRLYLPLASEVSSKDQ
ncbi:sensor histidine kinase [Photobacterium carnosum]|uniref:sensor histidine kinase n=1 Tax=Photobacterium carnosum TaxID=2023717 RepID=UPI001E64AB9E|nr:HAMP domain-containing sensor histidine kinase [Photobacterium carnosum]MCD9530518.1 two-component sensor histidine kinase [Photobacterium carnosum]MCF2154215.1 two-component sensor histidine kinase [Photobacterium carnosum]MCF2216009.1 two-component sensor histidine kinase [Photobacterium carnosum]